MTPLQPGLVVRHPDHGEVRVLHERSNEQGGWWDCAYTSGPRRVVKIKGSDLREALANGGNVT